MKKRTLIFGMAFFVVFVFTATAGAYDLVLQHGLTNKHGWSDSFIDKCLQKFGSGNVYITYTNESTRVWTRWINGRKVYYCGENDHSAGDDTIARQAQLLRIKTQLLQSSYGLSTKFKIIGHSMGGLVSRRYIYDNPNTVAGLVTLGTPHQGSEVAYVGDFVIDWFLGAEDAIKDLKPSFVRNTFNQQYPAPGPMADGGQIYTIAGDADGWDCWGWGGELFAGYRVLRYIYWKDSDGLVPKYADRLSGAIEKKKFWSYDHQELVTKSAVADEALRWVTP